MDDALPLSEVYAAPVKQRGEVFLSLSPRLAKEQAMLRNVAAKGTRMGRAGSTVFRLALVVIVLILERISKPLLVVRGQIRAHPK